MEGNNDCNTSSDGRVDYRNLADVFFLGYVVVTPGESVGLAHLVRFSMLEEI